MPMEKHRCKLCYRNFSNGKALGGHMRSHLATLPLPVKKVNHVVVFGDRTESDSSSTQSEHEHDYEGVRDDKLVAIYKLRENPRRSVKASDPDTGSVVLQDRESEAEAESTQNPTRRRSKRATRRGNEVEPKKSKLVGSESATESAPVSSVSDASQDEEVALCLMMMSRDVWVRVAREGKSVEDTHDSAELKKATRQGTRTARFKCMGCKKVFRTSRALAGHKASNKECCQQENYIDENVKIYECPFCYKVFGSGQALGGHKRSHLLAASTSNVVAASSTDANADKFGDSTSFILDLNLPAPAEDGGDLDPVELVFV